jgi:hypothetical protein
MSRAGTSTRRMAEGRASSARRLLLVSAAFGLVVLIGLGLMPSMAAQLGSAGLVLVLAVVVLYDGFADAAQSRADSLFAGARQASRGAAAEERVEDLLMGLDSNFHPIHDIASPYGNIDHVILSRQGGVYLIETKAHGGRAEVVNGALLVNGHPPEKDFVAQTLRNTFWLKDQVGALAGVTAWITPIIVFTNAFVPPCSPIKGVRIMNKRYLRYALEQAGQDAGHAASRLWETRGALEAALTGGRP